MNAEQILDLKIHAAHVRKMALEAVYSAGAGHPGGSLSAADILTYLYFSEMNVKADDAKNPDRDRFVLSKGHCSPALYGVLAEAGFIPKEDIKTFRSIDSYLQGHPDMKGVNGVDMSTGSLGQGISAACGMAIAAKQVYHIPLPASSFLAMHFHFWSIPPRSHFFQTAALNSYISPLRSASLNRYSLPFQILESAGDQNNQKNL